MCGAHLLRELAFIVDAHHYAWAKRMKRLLLGACHQVSKRDDKTLRANEYKALQKRYRTILTQGARELPPIPPRQNGQRGKVAKSDAHNLWERLKNYETAVLRFAKHPDVAFTNNRAERDLPMAKVKQKVSGYFRTRKYAQAYCRISSYLQSMANQGYNPLVAIQIALAGRAIDNMGHYCPNKAIEDRWPGGRGWLPTRGSHRSGLAQLRHPAPRTMVSLLNGTPASCITFLSEQAFAPQNTRFWSRRRVWFQFTVGEDKPPMLSVDNRGKGVLSMDCSAKRSPL